MLMPEISRRTAILAATATAAMPAATVATPAIAPSELGRRYMDLNVELNTLFANKVMSAEVRKAIEVAFAEQHTIASQIIALPPTLSSIVDKAIVGADYWSAVGSRWPDLRSPALFDRSVAELALSVLMLAGLTDGTAERGPLPAPPLRNEPTYWGPGDVPEVDHSA